jgi:hypothetical protein
MPEEYEEVEPKEAAVEEEAANEAAVVEEKADGDGSGDSSQIGTGVGDSLDEDEEKEEEESAVDGGGGGLGGGGGGGNLDPISDPIDGIDPDPVNDADGIIRVRSPYFIRSAEQTDPELSYFQILVLIRDGHKLVQGDCDNINELITVNKRPIGNETSVTFDFTEIAKNYLEQNYQSNLVTAAYYQSLWVTITITARKSNDSIIGTTTNQKYLIQEGYNLFEEGVNYTEEKLALITASCINHLKGENIVIPVNIQQVTSVKFYSGSTLINTQNVNDSNESSEKIKYITQTNTDDEAINRVTFNGPRFATSLTIDKIEECKYPINKIVFVNRWGAYEELFFFKKSTESLSSTKQEFNGSIFKAKNVAIAGNPCVETTTYNQYSINSHSKQSYNANATQSITLNSGFVGECRNPSFEELMVSEYIWLINPRGIIQPVNLKESSFAKKTGLNDGLINYTMSFDISAKLVNNIR